MRLSAIFLATLFGSLLLGTTPQTASAVEGFPVFTYDKVLLNPANLTYNPTGEIIFPSIIKASDYFSNPLATYYMYYAPHDAPGGICLAYSNSLDGPWTEYAANPIISNQWSPNYSVSHVSSPHAIWISGVNKLYLYFHGENTTTRVANSSDGLNFTYDKVVITTASVESGVTETSYARVFKYTIPSKNNVYTMMFMGVKSGTRKIYLAWSNDARNWTAQATPLISPNTEEGGQISAATLFPWNGKTYVVYHGGSGNMYATEVGPNFDMERHAGLFHDSLSGAPDNGRSASAVFNTIGNTMYMVYEAGQRSATKIALAKANLATTWNVFDDDLSNSALWSNAGTGGSTTWSGGTARVIDNNTSTYYFLTRNGFSPVSGAYTLEFTAKTNSAGSNEISVRSGSYHHKILINHGTAGTVKDNDVSPTKSYTLNTTVYHTYRMVVHANSTYDLYVDGGLVWSGAGSKGSGTNIMKIGASSPNQGDITVDAIKMGSGELIP